MVPAELHPCRTTADNDEGERSAYLIRFGVALRPFEGAEQALPDRQRVGE